MNASEFIFNGKSSKEFGVVIGSFDSPVESGKGGEIEVISVQTPNKDEYDYYGRKISNVIVWNFSIIKNTCDDNDIYFSVDEERHINKWLKGVLGYKELLFVTNDEPVYYFVIFQVTPHTVAGKTVGYDLVATSNCGYGFSEEYNYDMKFQNGKIKLQLNNDMPEYVFPRLEIKNGSGNFYIKNETYSYTDDNSYQTVSNSVFYNINNTLVMDSKNDIITGLTYPDSFNYNMLKLVDGMNILTTNASSDLELSITYREIRMVIV